MADRFEEQLTQDFVLIMGALADQRDATRGLARVVELQRQNGEEQRAAILDIRDSLQQQQELLRQQQEMLQQQQEMLGHQQSMVERHDSMLERQVHLSEEQAIHLAQCQASIDRAESSMEGLRGHLMQAYGQQKQSNETLADHEARISALERRHPPAA